MKCYVCKYLNAAKEASLHPNPTTKTTAQLLHERVVKHRKNKRRDHVCETHLDPHKYSQAMEAGGKIMSKLLGNGGQSNGKTTRQDG